MKTLKNNAVLVLHLPDGKHIIVQDRRGYKPPLWGYFGGGLEAGETPLQAILREIREELDLHLQSEDVELWGCCTGETQHMMYTIHVFGHAFSGDPAALTVLEGAGLDVVIPQEMLTRCEEGGPDEAITKLVMEKLPSQT
ncbi:NUDIX domain-containing protein [Deinococcus roseus]|uniref:Nudix hydrolase domain-containing protein n=1 Tax=Deinococcus roseus TaxID=392414 RepID=A0ABQ2D006_9DEIO|nr:NUDIX hydrolase [Deinococcus roseus]GGJ37885.1 hypothetical protein GCM10008938_24970 [Deinococcus roseus]